MGVTVEVLPLEICFYQPVPPTKDPLPLGICPENTGLFGPLQIQTVTETDCVQGHLGQMLLCGGARNHPSLKVLCPRELKEGSESREVLWS